MALTAFEIEDIAVRAAIRASKEAVAEFALTPEGAQQLVADTVKQTLIQLGIDSANPLEMQKDFQHLRQWRRAGDDLRSKGMIALLTIFIAGIISLILAGAKNWFAGP